MRSVIAAPLSDLGLQTLIMCLWGRLLTLRVMLSVTDLAGTILTGRWMLLLSCTIDFPLRRPLTRVRVVLSVPL